uniref:Uncharacterized protein n=1 Tax=Arundo donax TaxID=35708 RepID=A0A0A8ZM53_ARUDO
MHLHLLWSFQYSACKGNKTRL